MSEQQQGEERVEQQDEQEIERERAERLDPDNRPETAEVDNTQRTFDHEKGVFTDDEAYDDAEPKFVSDEDLTGDEDDEDE